MKSIFLLNTFGCLFILYLMFHALRVTIARKKCKPIHKQPFRIQKMKRSRKSTITIVISLLIWVIWIIGIIYYDMYQLFLLYFAALFSITAYYPLFQQGKVGKDGIAIADKFIPWQDIENVEFITPKISDFHYPDQLLTVFTKNGFHCNLIIDKKYSKEVSGLLTH